MATASPVKQTGNVPETDIREAPLIRLSRVVPNPHQPRKTFIESTIENLADSIQEEGQRTPVEVCKVSGSSGNFMLIAGERRWRALHKIWERTGKEPYIKAFIEVVKDEKELFRRSFVENLHREDMCALDTAEGYQKLHKDGLTIAQVAELAKKSATHIENYLKLTKLPNEVKAMMDPNLPDERKLAVTIAIDIARSIPMADAELRTRLAREAVERNLGVGEARLLVEHEATRKGYTVGGAERKPSDEYKALASFLGRTDDAAFRLSTRLDLTRLYQGRTAQEQQEDLKVVDRIIDNLRVMREKIAKG